MEILTSDNYCIITPFSKKLNAEETLRILKVIEQYNGLNIGLNLDYVKECSIDFIEKIRAIKNIGLFNIPSDVFTIFNIMNVDKFVNLYVSEEDYKGSVHRLINRKFSLV